MKQRTCIILFYIFGLILIVFSSVSATGIHHTDITFSEYPPMRVPPGPKHFILLENQTSYNIIQENADVPTTIEPCTLCCYFTTEDCSFIFQLNKAGKTKRISVPHQPPGKLSLIMIVERPTDRDHWVIHIPYGDDTFSPVKHREYKDFLTRQAKRLKALIDGGEVTPDMSDAARTEALSKMSDA